MLSLLLRLTECSAGEIMIDGHNIREVGLRRLRRAIGLVPQTPFLFEVRASCIHPSVTARFGALLVQDSTHLIALCLSGMLRCVTGVCPEPKVPPS